MEKNERRIALPEGVDADIEGQKVILKGQGREVRKVFSAEGIAISKEQNEIVLRARKMSNREVAKMNAMVSHIKNLIVGTQKDFEYKMAVIFSHFPMTLNVKDNTVEINNFLGEKNVRKARVLPGVTVRVKGKEVVVTGANKETVSQTAANIEGTARVVGRDKRIYQDGIFIVSKGK